MLTKLATDYGFSSFILWSASNSATLRSFIDDIAAPNRLVITAARGDRTSFGCRDGAEWTEFGESFFDRALRAERDPRKAFPVAAEDVARKEAADGLTPSQPQIADGAEIGAVLDGGAGALRGRSSFDFVAPR
ncbi:MAG: hypothetical protein HC794_08015 [Nitrospiraceae bacterium]|nr:hypothetical protein [Nitrospiraceae bacterium]